MRAAWAIRDLGFDAVVVNNNPETVSTDYDACSRLYFEPLDTESVLDVLDHERALTGEPPLVLLTFGGQTAIDLVPKQARRKEVNVALSNSFGFGGTNASLILRRVS